MSGIAEPKDLLSTLCLAGCLLCSASHAEVLELEGTVKSIDTDTRAITIVRKTPKGEKVLELEVAENAADFLSIDEGDEVRITYDPALGIATEVVSTGTSPLPLDKSQDDSGFVSLINDKDLGGWYLTTRSQDRDKPLPSKDRNWEVRKGVLKNTAAGRHLASDETYLDFELMFEFRVPSNCNSGIYLRGAYELKLKDADPFETKPTERCGAIFNLVAPTANPFTGPDKWNKCKVLLQGDTVTVVINDTEVISDGQLPDQVPGHFNPAPDKPGPLVLHSHPKGVGIMYRNMKIRSLPLGE